ncbi:MAG TPA: FHA domain-containing protein [Tepidisphaeraceae bacterium]|jgi:predicted component of type VI protein secretion system|nr:FHA domain-containing protein [Tepidisphaeraceae bacterium]
MKEWMAYVVIRDLQGEVLLKTELKTSVTVGRGPTCEVRVKDPQVSREHCVLEPWGEGWRLKDLGSQNRTYVNGRAVNKEQVLADGDVIELGKDRMTFFAGRLGRVRATDPVMAGLVDAESQGASGQMWQGSGEGRSESSLYATRVMAEVLSTKNESTITGAQGVANEITPKIVPAKVKQVVKEPARHWALAIGAIALIAAAIIVGIWLR